LPSPRHAGDPPPAALRAASGNPDQVFSALGDPTRREVLQAVSARGDATATELAATMSVTRQAVAKHLGVLAGAGLVEPRRAGRETRYAPTPEPLGDAIAWMTALGAEWDARLGRLQRSVTPR
jgi:DNA-binding transcriptional ArsR family regulator